MSERLSGAHRRFAGVVVTGLCAATGLGCADETPSDPAEPPPGSIVIVVSVTGEGGLDGNGFQVRVDGAAPLSMEVEQEALLVSGLTPGQHTVSLEGVAHNCVVSSANPQAPAVLSLQVTAVFFGVICEPRAFGIIRVFAPPLQRFVAALSSGRIGLAENGRVEFRDLPPGEYSVRVHIYPDDAGGCLLAGPDSQQVAVSAGRITDAVFSLTACPTGSLEVVVTTTGSITRPPPTGWYVYALEDGDNYCYYGTCTAAYLAADGRTSFPALRPAKYYVTLRGLPQQCTAVPGHHLVTVVGAARAVIGFEVTCS